MNKKTDQEFFDYYCQCTDTLFSRGSQKMVFIKNTAFEIVYISKLYAATFAPDSIDTLNGDHLPEVERSIYQSITETAINQDKQIQETRLAKNYIYIDSYHHINQIHKRPIINPDTNNFVGIIGYVSHFAMPNILKLIHKINGINYGLANKVPKIPLKYDLSEKQNMVLFLYLNKYTNVEISEILTLLGFKTSRSRVNDHLENLKFIFYVKTKEQLIEKAISLNYHLLIPRKFLQVGTYELDDEIIISG